MPVKSTKISQTNHEGYKCCKAQLKVTMKCRYFGKRGIANVWACQSMPLPGVVRKLGDLKGNSNLTFPLVLFSLLGLQSHFQIPKTGLDLQQDDKGGELIEGNSLSESKLLYWVMFYEPGKTDHGLPFDPFKACVVPRPIGWISTVSPEGIANLAPYSQFQNLTFDPPYVMFSANQTPENVSKDSARNAESTGIFCWQLATYELRELVNITSEQFPHGVDEFQRASLEKSFSTVLKPAMDIPEFQGVPMVAASPVRFECEYHSTIRLPGHPPMGSVDIVIGKVVGVHISDAAITNGKVDIRKTQPIARCGYYEYAVVRDTFEMAMPGAQIMRDGLEGSSKRNREAAQQARRAHSSGRGANECN